MTDNPFSLINEKMAEALAKQFDQPSVLGSFIRAEAKVAATPPQKIHSNAIAISREMALDFGLVEPTPREQAERDELTRKWHARRVVAYPQTIAYAEALDAITEQPARAILDLHHRDGTYAATCTGCDFQGWESEPPEWPCSTVTTLADHYGITTPDLIVFEEPTP